MRKYISTPNVIYIIISIFLIDDQVHDHQKLKYRISVESGIPIFHFDRKDIIIYLKWQCKYHQVVVLSAGNNSSSNTNVIKCTVYGLYLLYTPLVYINKI